MNEECGRHAPVFDDEVGCFCARCGELFDPDEMREFLAARARADGVQPGEGLIGPDGRMVMSADPDAIDMDDPDLASAFAHAMSKPWPVYWTYLAWTCCPGRDWAPPPSLTCRVRGSSYRRCESERPRRQRACVRACPSDGPPAVSAGIGSVPVIDP